jgi:hypothetical protein
MDATLHKRFIKFGRINNGIIIHEFFTNTRSKYN